MMDDSPSKRKMYIGIPFTNMQSVRNSGFVQGMSHIRISIGNSIANAMRNFRRNRLTSYCRISRILFSSDSGMYLAYEYPSSLILAIMSRKDVPLVLQLTTAIFGWLSVLTWVSTTPGSSFTVSASFKMSCLESILCISPNELLMSIRATFIRTVFCTYRFFFETSLIFVEVPGVFSSSSLSISYSNLILDGVLI